MKIMSLAMAALMGMSLIAGSTATAFAEEADDTEVTVFAAASMTETLDKIGAMYMEENPDVTLIFNYDSSGTLKTQIQEGAVCDLFISAGQKQMDQLDIEADPEVNTEKLDFVDETTRINILENKVTLCVTEDNEKGLESFDDMKDGLADGSILMAMGNSDVPVGQYTQKILDYYGTGRSGCYFLRHQRKGSYNSDFRGQC